MKCTICQKPVAARTLNGAFPFCSPRCKAVDLGKWLGEEYRVASRHVEEEEDESPLKSPSESSPEDA